MQCVHVRGLHKVGGTQWENGPNHALHIPEGAGAVFVHFGWEAGDMGVEVQEAPPALAPAPAPSPAAEDSAAAPAAAAGDSGVSADDERSNASAAAAAVTAGGGDAGLTPATGPAAAAAAAAAEGEGLSGETQEQEAAVGEASGGKGEQAQVVAPGESMRVLLRITPGSSALAAVAWVKMPAMQYAAVGCG
jgi:hypothetical protein